jgi:hypothetical protein
VHCIDLVALSNVALYISIPHKKSIIETNIIRLALRAQTWGLGAFFYSSLVNATHVTI